MGSVLLRKPQKHGSAPGTLVLWRHCSEYIWVRHVRSSCSATSMGVDEPGVNQPAAVHSGVSQTNSNMLYTVVYTYVPGKEGYLSLFAIGQQGAGLRPPPESCPALSATLCACALPGNFTRCGSRSCRMVVFTGHLLHLPGSFYCWACACYPSTRFWRQKLTSTLVAYAQAHHRILPTPPKGLFKHFVLLKTLC